MSTEERFWSKVRKAGHDECWEWTGYKNRGGYGVFRLHSRPASAHRMAWTLARGPIPAGLFVCHHCDNPPCCNPSHLFVGTYRDNIDDMVAKGRQLSGDRHNSRTQPECLARGEENGNAKLTASQVREIVRRWKQGETQSSLAREFGMSQPGIGLIVRGERWAHLFSASKG